MTIVMFTISLCSLIDITNTTSKPSYFYWYDSVKVFLFLFMFWYFGYSTINEIEK